MLTNAQTFRVRLVRATGLSEAAISAAWPDWWSDEVDASPSAQAELRFSLARKLGLDARSLLDDDEPRFVWRDDAKYKNFTGEDERERPAISSFGISVGRLVLRGVVGGRSLKGVSAMELRQKILATQPFVRLQDMVGLLWAVGIPALHLRVHPLSAKRMCAMAVSTADRYAVLIAKDYQYPAATIFHLAHEVGHIALGHVQGESALVDMTDLEDRATNPDDEESAADRYALELLTGNPDFTVQKRGRGRSAKNLANEVLAQGAQNGIEPGTLALCYGYATGDWGIVQASMPHIYGESAPVWSFINRVANKNIDWTQLSDDNASFLRAVMGGVIGS